MILSCSWCNFSKEIQNTYKSDDYTDTTLTWTSGLRPTSKSQTNQNQREGWKGPHRLNHQTASLRQIGREPVLVSQARQRGLERWGATAGNRLLTTHTLPLLLSPNPNITTSGSCMFNSSHPNEPSCIRPAWQGRCSPASPEHRPQYNAHFSLLGFFHSLHHLQHFIPPDLPPYEGLVILPRSFSTAACFSKHFQIPATWCDLPTHTSH